MFGPEFVGDRIRRKHCAGEWLFTQRGERSSFVRSCGGTLRKE